MAKRDYAVHCFKAVLSSRLIGWEEFRAKYLLELRQHPETLAELRRLVQHHNISLITAAKNATQNHALVLKHYLEFPEDENT